MGFGWEFDLAFSLLAANAVILILCHHAAPRPWAKDTCRAAIALNGFLLLITAVLLSTTGLMAWSIFLWPWALILLEFLLLLRVYQNRFPK